MTAFSPLLFLFFSSVQHTKGKWVLPLQWNEREKEAKERKATHRKDMMTLFQMFCCSRSFLVWKVKRFAFSTTLITRETYEGVVPIITDMSHSYAPLVNNRQLLFWWPDDNETLCRHKVLNCLCDRRWNSHDHKEELWKNDPRKIQAEKRFLFIILTNHVPWMVNPGEFYVHLMSCSHSYNYDTGESKKRENRIPKLKNKTFFLILSNKKILAILTNHVPWMVNLGESRWILCTFDVVLTFV